MPLRLMVVDDSVLYRKVASDAARLLADVEVLPAAASGDLALRKLQQTPADVVLCDVHMPGMDGVQTLMEIRRQFPATHVIMMSGVSSRSADVTIQALECGALDFIKKPDGKTVEENLAYLKTELENVLRLVRVRINTAGIGAGTGPRIVTQLPAHENRTVTPGPPANNVQQHFAPIPQNAAVLAIGVSTGGPEALNKVIPRLPATFPVPIVLVQHMPPHFTKSLAESLDRKSPLTVVEASQGQCIEKGYVYIAPGGSHMTVRDSNGRIEAALNDGPPENSCRPAVDVLFRSVGTVYGSRGIVAVILTGMGNDGMRGVSALKRKGCYCLAQSAESCVVYGMPKAIVDAAMADSVVAIEDMAAAICRRFNCLPV